MKSYFHQSGGAGGGGGGAADDGSDLIMAAGHAIRSGGGGGTQSTPCSHHPSFSEPSTSGAKCVVIDLYLIIGNIDSTPCSSNF